MHSFRRLWCPAAGCALALAGGADPAINQFEVKDLEVEVGRFEFQSQNAHAWNQPSRAFVARPPGDFEYDDNAVVSQRHALELKVGIVEWLRSRVGVEFEKERLDEPPAFSMRDDFDALTLEELAIETMIVLVPVDDRRIGIGLLAEYQQVLEGSEPNSFVFGPIVEVRNTIWSLILNPTFVQFFNGDDGDDNLDFTYAAQIAYQASESWELALEAYGTVERLGSTGAPTAAGRLFGDHDLHRLGPMAYYQQGFGSADGGQLLTIGSGVLFGLNDATADYTLKWSVELDF